MGRGGHRCPAAHLCRPPRRTCPDDTAGQPPRNACPCSPDQRAEFPGESRDRRGHGDRHQIHREADSDPYAAGLRAAPGSALADAPGVKIPLPFPFTIAFADALLVAVGFAFWITLSVALALALAVAIALSVTEVLKASGPGLLLPGGRVAR